MASEKYQALRNSLYQLLEAATQEEGNGDNSVQAHQALGVQLTNAMRKDGVNIIQMQNIKAIGRITSTTVQALRELDQLEAQDAEIIIRHAEVPALPDAEPAQLEYNPPLEDALSYICRAMLGAGLDIKGIVKVIRYGAAMEAVALLGSNTSAAKALGVNTGYVSVLKRERPAVLDEEAHG